MRSAADFNLEVEVTKWKNSGLRPARSCVFFYDTDGRILLATNSLGLSLGVCVCINFPVCSFSRVCVCINVRICQGPHYNLVCKSVHAYLPWRKFLHQHLYFTYICFNRCIVQ